LLQQKLSADIALQKLQNKEFYFIEAINSNKTQEERMIQVQDISSLKICIYHQELHGIDVYLNY
jgi:hypothetical protein